MKRFTHRNEAFECKNCGKQVLEHQHGSCRNHCCHCLFSSHVDDNPGDRSSSCQCLMEPVFVEVRTDQTILRHRCQGCGTEKSNKTAPDDDFEVISSLVFPSRQS